MTDEKPVIFISHSSKDKELAQLLKQQIELCFDDGIEAFAADIEPGENWFDKVMDKLNHADAIIVLITPNSVNSSHWVWFEMGYFWARHDDVLSNLGRKEKIYYPIYVEGTEWPNPVKDLQIQAVRINDESEIKKFFDRLIGQFGIGEIDKVKLITITQYRIPVNAIENDSSVSVNSPRKQALISKDRACELTEDFIHNEGLKFWGEAKKYLYPDNFDNLKLPEQINIAFSDSRVTEYSGLIRLRNNIFAGKLIYYHELDQNLELPDGTSQKYIKEVAKRYHLYPVDGKDLEDCIRFEVIPVLEKDE